jgi:hypothetical protein
MALRAVPLTDQSSLTVNVYNGTRQLFPAGIDILYRVFDGNQTELTEPEKQVSSIDFLLPFYDNFGDNYRVIVFSDGYHQAGYTPVPLSPKEPATLDLMLIPKHAGLNFVGAEWDSIKTRLTFLANDVDDATGRDRYMAAMEDEPKSLACLLNITTSMMQIPFSDGSTPLDYLKVMKWDDSFAQDRFYAYCDAKLIDQVKAAAAAGEFAPEANPGAFHPGATSSWKQIQFEEANLQLTFHEADTKTINGVDCVLVEPDIDYYKDLLAHVLLEAIPNFFTGGLTNPELVYAMRWIVGRRADVDFNPPYTIIGV